MPLFNVALQGEWQEDEEGGAAMGGGAAVVDEEETVGRYPWEKSAVAESFLLQTGGRSGVEDAFEFVITDSDGTERVLGHRAWNKFYKQKHKPVSSNPNLQAVVSVRSNMLARATRGEWDTRLITMPMVLARAIAERKATMQQNLQLQRFIQKRALKLGQNYNKMFVCNKANNAQVDFLSRVLICLSFVACLVMLF